VFIPDFVRSTESKFFGSVEQLRQVRRPSCHPATGVKALKASRLM